MSESFKKFLADNEKYARAKERGLDREKKIKKLEPDLKKLQEQIESLHSKNVKDVQREIKDYVEYQKKNGIRDWSWILAHDHEVSRWDCGVRYNFAKESLRKYGILTSGFFPVTSQFQLILWPQVKKGKFHQFDEILRGIKEMEPYLIKADIWDGLHPNCYPIGIRVHSAAEGGPYLMLCEKGVYQVAHVTNNRYRRSVDVLKEFKQLKRALKYVFEEYTENY